MHPNRIPPQHPARPICLLAATLLSSTMLTGCIGAGASSTGGWFVWPGGLGLLVIILIAIFLMRGRR